MVDVRLLQEEKKHSVCLQRQFSPPLPCLPADLRTQIWLQLLGIDPAALPRPSARHRRQQLESLRHAEPRRPSHARPIGNEDRDVEAVAAAVAEQAPEVGGLQLAVPSCRPLATRLYGRTVGEPAGAGVEAFSLQSRDPPSSPTTAAVSVAGERSAAAGTPRLITEICRPVARLYGRDVAAAASVVLVLLQGWVCQAHWLDYHPFAPIGLLDAMEVPSLLLACARPLLYQLTVRSTDRTHVHAPC